MIKVWLALLPHNKKVSSCNPSWGLSVRSLHVHSMQACVLSRYSSFLPPSKNMHVRLFIDSVLSLGVSVSVHGCISHLSLCGPVIDRQPILGVPCHLPNASWDRPIWFVRIYFLVSIWPRNSAPLSFTFCSLHWNATILVHYAHWHDIKKLVTR